VLEVVGRLRPAAAFRRRSFVFLLVAGFLGSALSLRSGEETSTIALNQQALRRGARRAADQVRAHQPQQARLIERYLTEADRIAAQEAALASWNRTPGRVEAAWERVVRTSLAAVRTERNRTTAAKNRWDALAGRLADEVSLAQGHLASGGGLGYREAKAFRGALYHRDLAERSARSGDFDAATRNGEQALVLSDVVQRAFRALHSRFQDRRELERWRQWIGDTVDASRTSGGGAIVVDKLRRRLEVYSDGKKVTSFAAELGSNGLKLKRHAGDKATPEGRYRVTELRSNGSTRYYKALMLNYPNAEDLARFHVAKKRGELPPRVGIGSLIEIHGEGGKDRDWTDGCVALSNNDMDALFRYARVGMPVTIVGTRP